MNSIPSYEKTRTEEAEDFTMHRQKSHEHLDKRDCSCIIKDEACQRTVLLAQPVLKEIKWCSLQYKQLTKPLYDVNFTPTDPRETKSAHLIDHFFGLCCDRLSLT